VSAFHRAVEGEQGLVGVHCVHGINRTGYLICRYMVDRLGTPPEEAIKRFNRARGFPMTRPSLLQDLATRGWEGEAGARGRGGAQDKEVRGEEGE
jgi:atypical dual specificity phosphatase